MSHPASPLRFTACLFLAVCSAACGASGTDPAGVAAEPGATTGGRSGFSFAVMGDSRGGAASVGADGSGGIHSHALKKALDHLVTQGRADLVVFTGDMVQGATTSERLVEQLADWNAMVAPYQERGIRFLTTAGNHEIDDGTKRELEPARLGQPTAEALANQHALLAAFPDQPRNGPAAGGLTFWTRVYRGELLLVFLDSFRPGQFNTVDTAWLRQILSGPAVEPPPAHVFVVTHSPAFPTGGHVADSLPNYNLDRQQIADAGLDPWPWEPGRGGPRDVDVDYRTRRDTLWSALVEHRVTALLAGHEHNLSRQRVGGVWQLVSGGLANHLYAQNTVPLSLYGGAPQNPRAGDTIEVLQVYGYYLITVAGARARAEAFGWTEPDDPVRLLDSFDLR
jgi:hypothetical protein